MKRIVWWLAMAIIAPAAAGITAWSLYYVAMFFGVPQWLAVTTALVYDGVALGCLYLASEAVRAALSAAGPLAATFVMAGISVYLNVFHAQLIHGGTPAALFFATPTFGLLVLSHLAWSGTRNRARAARGDTPLRLPAYGVLTWLLAHEHAGKALKKSAEERVTGASSMAPAVAPRRTAREVLVEKFASLDPVDAVQLLAGANPHLDPAELAELAQQYGKQMTATDVALILGGERITVQRVAVPAPRPAPAAAVQPSVVPPAPQLPPPPAATPPMPLAPPAPVPAAPAPQGAAAGQGLAKAELVRQTAALLGHGATARIIAEAVMAQHGIAADASYVRTVQARDRKAAAKQATKEPLPVQDPLIGKGRNGYL
ncbi:hypothetical protein GCM10010193_70290 [Kitasatospora atroaurantiaca]|uniref:DUF2637 domain-containing protein n=1 Tax=Kitasatospora atroaurantiaca TaxID=285545 RepID=A0A561ENC6_9ACTN|nr:hypothetical protein [Kitasatospora atroaurantiaca]TWE17115.1 hypothetical protein FB465_2120 [Kitasatospora atroaurantiaca]